MDHVLLILSTFIWGMGFIAVKWTLVDYSAIESNLIRYAFAAVLALPIVIVSRAWNVDRKQLKGVFICSFFLFAMNFFQTWGLEYTSVAKSGFLTTLYAFFTPFLCMIFLKHRYRLGYWGLILMGILGIFLLGEMRFDGFNFGDFLTIICSICAAFHILAVEKYTHLFHSAWIFNCYQTFFVAIQSWVVFLIYQKSALDLRPLLNLKSMTFWGFIVLSVFSSLIAFSFQVSAQKKLPSHVVSLLFLLESPFAAIMGYILLGEPLSLLAMIGCTLILISVAFVPKFSKN